MRPDDELVVYCSNRDLLRRGYRNVRRCSGGLLASEDAGLPLEGRGAVRS